MVEKYNVGDCVRIETSTHEFEGRVLESPQDASEILLLKLDSGYNIGVLKKDLKSLKIVGNFSETSKTLDVKIPIVSGKKSIALIITGGTISSQLDVKTGAVKWITSPSTLLQNYPEIFDIANVAKVEVPFMKASENMNSGDWKKIAKVVEQYLQDPGISGIIITHGTDFLHYTGSALAFFLGRVNKPVVLTYAQRSSDRASSDARLNLVCAAQAAISDIAEVMLVGHATNNDDFCYAMPATKVRKMHTSRRDAFKIINSQPFAKITKEMIQPLSKYNIRSELKKKFNIDSVFDNKVALIDFYPGQDPSILEWYLKQGYRGIVLMTSGLGHLPTKESGNNWIPVIKKVIAAGMTVCAVPQTLYGRLNPKVYSAGRELEDSGIIFLQDMLPETAFVKLGWVLGHKDWKGKFIREKMLENVAGEFNERLEE